MATQTTSPKTQTSTPTKAFIIRTATLDEGSKIGQLTAEIYNVESPITHFLAPNRAQHYSHYERAFVQRARQRLLNPRCLCLVACEAARPDTPIGCAQFMRLGDDEGARRQIASQWSLRLWVLGWLFWVWYLVLDSVVGDKSVDREHLRVFFEEGQNHQRLYWRPFEERRNRWHAQSVVVKKEFQGNGIGKLFMGEVLSRAEKENVVVGLEASGPGERLYRKMGFELLGRFGQIGVHGRDLEAPGGIMIWTPSAWKAEKI